MHLPPEQTRFENGGVEVVKSYKVRYKIFEFLNARNS
jgi:hypothetical protein